MVPLGELRRDESSMTVPFYAMAVPTISLEQGQFDRNLTRSTGRAKSEDTYRSISHTSNPGSG
jgi:hypothetical protein